MGTTNSKDEAFGYTKKEAVNNLLILARGKYEKSAYLESYKCNEPDCCNEHLHIVFHLKRNPIYINQTKSGMYKTYFY